MNKEQAAFRAEEQVLLMSPMPQTQPIALAEIEAM
jgi:hypothetical protein